MKVDEVDEVDEKSCNQNFQKNPENSTLFSILL